MLPSNKYRIFSASKAAPLAQPLIFFDGGEGVTRWLNKICQTFMPKKLYILKYFATHFFKKTAQLYIFQYI